MKKTFAAILTGVALCSCSQRPDVTADYRVVPLPGKIEVDTAGTADKFFKLDKNTVIYYSDAKLANEAQFLAEYLKPLTGLDLKISEKEPSANYIELDIDGDMTNAEAYKIDIDPDKIDIEGGSAAGVFYAVQTLRKSIPEAGMHDVNYPVGEIEDAPRFGYRGAHFDVARHFFPADSVKTYLDMMALHNMNTFHWHLTEDQGWRIESDRYPLLTEIGSKRPGTTIGHNTEEIDTIPVEGFYTKEQIRDIIDYAAKRHITIIPEIDLPGHMQAALAAYPNLGCTGGPYEVWKRWGVSTEVLCAGNDSVYAFLDGVLDELTDLFPSEYIHIGGDECPKIEWEKCPKCQAKIKELGLKKDKEHTAEQKLQSHVTKHVSDFLASKGRKIIGWDEILEGGIAPDATVMSWRGEAGGIKASDMGHDVIMTPNTYLYFDYYQSPDRDKQPLAIGGNLPLDKVYSYEPTPDTMSPEQKAHIKGVQANLWTEYVPTFAHAQYMVLPRWGALAEIQWMQPGTRDYKEFYERLKHLTKIYDAEGYNYCTLAFEDENAGAVK